MLRQYYSEIRSEYERLIDLRNDARVHVCPVSMWVRVDYLALLERQIDILKNWLKILYVACELSREKFLEYVDLYWDHRSNVSCKQIDDVVQQSSGFTIDILLKQAR